MRNLKRALSLTLASVMLLGMMVVGSSAAAGYDDVDESNNVEAIEVLQEIEVMVGDERGFGPDRPVNRAEMAVVMGKLLNLDYNYYSAACPFNDVYDWARGYVGACYANKILSGRGDGVYDPGSSVTAVEAAMMLMRALGYFQYSNDVADGWILATVAQGNKIGIFDGVDANADSAMTRDQVAQMVLNALQCAVVEPDGNTTTFLNPDGTVLATTGKVNYVSVTSNKPFASAISKTQATSIGSTNDGWIVELGERLYNGDLRLTAYDTDAFQRPARTWEYDGKEIGTYVKKELLRQSYTEKVTGRMLYDLLTKNTIETYDFVIAIDGETEQTYLDTHGYYTEGNLIRSNTEAVAASGKGVLTEVYVDTKAEIVYIATINTFLAKANADFNEKKDEVTFEVWSLFNEGTATDKHLVKVVPATNAAKQSLNLTVKGEDFNVADVKEGDIVLVNVAEGEVKKIFDPEIVDDTTITSFKRGSWVNAGGTQYDYAHTAQYDEEVLDDYDQINMKDTNYRVFLDKYGYMIGLEIIEAPSQYAFLAGIDGRSSNIDNKTARGNLIFTDGTAKTVDINMEKSKAQVANPTTATPDQVFTPAALWNTWCTYSVDANGVYTLTEVAYNDAQFTTNSSGAVYTNNKTDKVGQGRNAEATNDKGVDLTADSKNLLGTIDKKQISLNSNITNYKKVYGNDDSVYMVAGTQQIVDATYIQPGVTGQKAVIINDVDSVVTGVQNTSLDVFAVDKVKTLNSGKNTITEGNTSANTSHGVYTLFSDKGYVIAAVVVGEDNGVSSTYAYVTSSVAQEDWRSSSSDWKWYRDVIIDGEVVTLEEIGDSMSELKKMAQNNWYEVKFKADGTVKSVSVISTTDVHANANGTASNADEYIFCTNPAHFGAANDYPKFVGKIEMVEDAQLDNSGKVVLFEDMTANTVYKLNSTSNSFQVQNKVTGQVSKGFSVSPNAKIVLVQDKQVISASGTQISYATMDIIETNYSAGGAGLAQALKYLNDNDNDGIFQGYVSAVFENGFATSVVIYETDPNKVNWGDSNARNNILVTVANGVVTVDFTNGGSNPGGLSPDGDPWTLEEQVAAIEAALIKAGYTDPDIQISGGRISSIKAKSGNTTYNFTLAGSILPYTADVALALTTPVAGSGNAITGGGATRTVAVNVVNTTASVVITGAKTADQTVAIGGDDAADVTAAGSDTAPTYTVDTSAIATAGGSKTFTLTVSETGARSIVYNVTVTVAPAAAPATADVALALTTPSVGGGNSITGGGATKTVAVNVANTTASVVITGTKTAAQTVAIGGTNAADVTAAGTDTAPTYTVDTSAIASAGGSKTFTLTVAETGKTSIVYNVTVTVAAAAPADTADVDFALTSPAGGTNTLTGGGAARTVAVNVANTTASVVITGTKTAAQTVTVGGTDAGDVTAAGSGTAPTYTVDTSAIASGGGSKTFTLTVSETGKSDIVYTVTVTVATP